MTTTAIWCITLSNPYASLTRFSKLLRSRASTLCMSWSQCAATELNTSITSKQPLRDKHLVCSKTPATHPPKHQLHHLPSCLPVMAATPPLQIRSSVRTPPAPLHGPTYDNFDSLQPRHHTRSSQRKSSRDSLLTPEAFNLTPRPGRLATALSRQSSRSSTPNPSHLHSPQHSPRRKSTRRVQIVSPPSPALDSLAPTPFASDKSQPTFLSTNTVMADGMLPTPVKTPRKKVIPGVNAAARALFQDQPILGEEITSNSRRGRKSRRYNGFTLDSFSAEDEGAPGNIQIFTDSRDNVPEIDTSEENPFIDHPAEKGEPSSKKVAGTSKRRKVSGETKLDHQVQEAIKNDEGMIYVQ